MSSKGFSFIEILIVVAILMVGLVALGQLSANMVRALDRDELFQKASYYAEEGIEAARLLRDESWIQNIANKAQGTTYYLELVGGQWELTGTNPGALEGIFTRTIAFNDVQRDSSDNIVLSDGTTDAGTRRVTVTVSWGGGPAQNTSITTYLTNSLGETEAVTVEFTSGIVDADLANFPDNSGWGDPAQNFTATETVSVSKAELFIKRATADPSDIFVELRSGGPRGSVLATSQTIDSAQLASSYGWVTFSFGAVANITSGQTYSLRIRSIPDSTTPFSGAQPRIHWGYAFPGSYAGGTAYRYVTSLSDQILSSYDFSFKVYKKIN